MYYLLIYEANGTRNAVVLNDLEELRPFMVIGEFIPIFLERYAIQPNGETITTRLWIVVDRYGVTVMDGYRNIITTIWEEYEK